MPQFPDSSDDSSDDLMPVRVNQPAVVQPRGAQARGGGLPVRGNPVRATAPAAATEVARLRTESNSLKQEKQQLLNECQELRNNLKRVQADAEAAKTAAAKLSSELDDLKGNHNRLLNECEDLRKSLESARVDAERAFDSEIRVMKERDYFRVRLDHVIQEREPGRGPGSELSLVKPSPVSPFTGTIQTGTYIITNVRFRNVVVLLDGNKFSTFVSGVQSGERGEKWVIKLHSNDQHTIKNDRYNLFADCLISAREKDVIHGSEQLRLWNIRELNTKGRYVIFPNDSQVYWGLEDNGLGTSVTFSGTPNNEQNQWIFTCA